jgi:hypothetical protein
MISSNLDNYIFHFFEFLSFLYKKNYCSAKATLLLTMSHCTIKVGFMKGSLPSITKWCDKNITFEKANFLTQHISKP